MARVSDTLTHLKPNPPTLKRTSARSTRVLVLFHLGAFLPWWEYDKYLASAAAKFS